MSSPLRRTLAAFVLLLVAAGGIALSLGGGDGEPRRAAAADHPETATTLPDDPQVLVIGDSNLEYANQIVLDVLGASGFDVVTHGKAGYGLKDLDSYWLVQLPGLLAVSNPDVVIVALGTNDALPDNAAAFAARLDRLMQALGGRRVIWVTHTEVRSELLAAGSKIVNQSIRDAQARYANLTVLDLAPLEIANSSALFNDDLVHFNETGQYVLADEMVQATRQVVTAPVNVPVPITVPVTIPSVNVPTLP